MTEEGGEEGMESEDGVWEEGVESQTGVEEIGSQRQEWKLSLIHI